jgi:hypothetical protein
MGPMPGTAIRIDVWIGCLGECAVDFASLVKPSGTVHRRANQWMTEHHSRTGNQPAFRFDGVFSRLGDSESPGRCPQQRGIANRVGRGQEQQAPRIVWKRREASREAFLDAGGHGRRGRHAKTASQLRRGQPSRQLEHGQRVTARLDHDPIEHALV